MITFTVPGNPKGKGRPRVTRFGTYTPKATKDYEKLVKQSYLSAGNPVRETSDKPLSVHINAVFGVPKSYSKKKTLAMLGTHHTKKPDADNIAKAILDALNGVAFPDDSAISVLYVNKTYGEVPCVAVTIMEVTE